MDITQTTSSKGYMYALEGPTASWDAQYALGAQLLTSNNWMHEPRRLFLYLLSPATMLTFRDVLLPIIPPRLHTPRGPTHTGSGRSFREAHLLFTAFQYVKVRRKGEGKAYYLVTSTCNMQHQIIYYSSGLLMITQANNMETKRKQNRDYYWED
jgi:hypothetical protein